jgi:hypothetical protein
MLTYVLVILVVIAVLYFSFRALGGGTAVTPEDYRTVLARIGEFTAARAADLDASLDAETASAARKKLTGYQEQLSRLEPDAGGDAHEQDVLQSARSLLSVAIEDLGWACRMVEAGNYDDNQGVQRAVGELRSAAAECLAAAQRLHRPADAQREIEHHDEAEGEREREQQ